MYEPLGNDNNAFEYNLFVLCLLVLAQTLFFIHLYMYIHTHNHMDKYVHAVLHILVFTTYANMRHKSLPAVHVLTNLDGNQSLSGFGYVSRNIDVCTRGILEFKK